MEIYGVELIDDGDMVLHHQQRTGRPFEAESMAAWMAACSGGGVVCDVGAYTGLYSLVAAGLGASVIAYEPNLTVYHRLRQNVMANELRLKGVVLTVPVAVSSQQGQVALSVNPRVKLTSGGCVVSGTGISAVTIDSQLSSAAEGELLAAIKIDVEGHECDVIRGAIETLRRCMPLVITEALDDQAYADQQALLVPLGYQHQRADERNVIWRPRTH